MPQPLNSKESSLFRTVVKNYESKQYKKGLKSADQILRKNPKHGDTQAMKALLLNSLGQPDEAFVLAKEALKCDMKSHVCWHVYGLLWRSVRNFEEAIKAYRFALKLDPESLQISRDLALLQVQMRDFQGYIQSRKSMLQQRPQLRQNWTAMAIAHHLAGDLQQAEKVLKTYEDTLKNPPPKSDSEHSEAVLYKNTIMAEMGDVERALDHLETVSKANLDKLAIMEMRADYLLRLGRLKDAEEAYRALLERNGELRAYYDGLEKALGIQKGDVAARRELYGSYAQNHDRLDAARRIPLDFLEGSDFKEFTDHYLRRMFVKGVPSVFNNVKALYGNATKRGVIQDLVEGYASGKHMNGSMTSHVNGNHSDRFDESVLYFLAQHYNYKLTRDLGKAMELTERLIEKNSKTYDYQMMKARILKHQGNPAEASKVMNYARELDVRDRYINTKCAKYQLRNEQNDAALETMSRFTKNDTVGGTLGDLHEMQSLWYITEDGESFVRQGKLGRALKRFHSVFDIFSIWEEDQFDFHGFSLRKGQIRAYIDMIRWEDKLREHPFYFRAALNAIRIYIFLADRPELAQADGLPFDFGSFTEADKKKVLKKVRKDQEAFEKDYLERKDADKKIIAKKGSIGVDGEVKKTDEDPRGLKLLETSEPLQTAMKFLNPLVEFGSRNLETQHVGFEVYIRRRKFWLALKSILTAFSIDPSDPTAHQQTLRFRRALNEDSFEEKSSVTEIANARLPPPYNDASKSLASLNETFLSSNPKSVPHIISYIRAEQSLTPESTSTNQEMALKTLEDCTDMSLDDASSVLELLRFLRAPASTFKAFGEKAKARWPEASVSLDREVERGGSLGVDV